VDGIYAVILLDNVFNEALAQPFNNSMLTLEVTGFEIEKRETINYMFGHR
jgi:hypothetical protein